MTSTIITKNSSTASSVPLAADLTQGELAVNVTDKKLYSKDSGGSVVKLVGSLGNQEANAAAITGGTINGTAIGGTTAAAVSATTLTTSSTVTLNGGTANGVTYLNGSKVLTSGSALTFDGTTLYTSAAMRGAGGFVFEGASVGSATGPTLNGGYSTGGTTAFLQGYNFTSSAFIPLTFTGSYIAFSATSEGMRLTSTGLGIGTSSPAARLSVIAATANSTAATIGGIEYAGSKRGLTIKTYQSAGGDDCGVEFNAANGLAGYGAFKFAANTTTLATLDSAGNLGLGVTPSAWGSAYKALQLSAGSFSGNAGAIGYEQNAYNNGSNWIYRTTAAATHYETYGGGHYWFNAPSGTAGNAISFTQAMTLDASGNLGVGTTSPVTRVHVYNASSTANARIETASAGSYAQLDLVNPSNTVNIWNRGDISAFLIDSVSWPMFIRTMAAQPLGFSTNGIERARIDSSGNLLVGATATINAAKMLVQFTSSNNGFYLDETSNTSGTQYLRFSQSGTTTGSITRVAQTSAVTYNTTSDYRLKDVVGAVTGSGTRIDALEPVEYTWKADGTRTRGFLAHKFQEVYAHSVTGTKDAVDANGNPEYQSMQASSAEVIADLVAEIQSLRQRVAQLETN